MSPQKKANLCRKIKSLVGFIFRGFEMFSLLISFIVRLRRGFASNSRNSRFGGINSRLGPQKFPIGVATVICSQAFEFASVLLGEMAVWRRESKKFPAQREKPGMRPCRTAPQTEKYFACGWWTTIAEVDCSGSSWSSSERVMPISSAPSSAKSCRWSARLGQAG